MTTEEKIYTLQEASKLLVDTEKDLFTKYSTHKWDKKKRNPQSLGELLGVMYYSLAQELVIEQAKRDGSTTQLRALQRIVNGLKGNKSIKGTQAVHDCRYVQNGSCVVRIFDDSPMPRMAECASPINYAKEVNKRVKNLQEVNIPDLTDVKARILVGKEIVRHRHTVKKRNALTLWKFDINGNETYVNASMMVDLIEALPDCKMYVFDNGIYCKNGNGDGMLLKVINVSKDNVSMVVINDEEVVL